LKFRVLTALFNRSWLVFARVPLSLPIWKDRVRAPRLLHVHALGSLNVHWMALVLTVALRIPLEYFLYYEIACFPLLALWVAFTEVTSPRREG
jgi:hypothetical protein